MAFIISSLTVLIAAATTSYLWKKRLAFTLPLVFAALALVLYITSMLNVRHLGVWAYCGATAALLVVSIWKYIKKRDVTLRSLGVPELIFVVISMIVIGIITRNFVLNDWDEFAQWGLVLKNLFYNNGLAVAGNTTAFHLPYPEGVSLVQSFFNQFGHVFSEPNTLRSLMFLSVAQLGIVYGGIKKAGLKVGLMIGIAITVLPYVFFTNFHGTTYIDAFIGLLIGNILFFEYIYKKRDLFYCVYMSLQLAFLVNSKQIGIVVAGIIIALIAIRWFHSIRSETTQHSARKVVSKSTLYAVIPIVVAALVFGSWKLYTDAHNYKDIVDIHDVSIANIKSVVTGVGGEDYRHVTYHNFVQQFFATRDFGSIPLSYFAWSLLVLVGLYTLQGKKNSGQRRTYPVILTAGLYGYAGVLLFLYLFAFIPYEAQMVASFSRYLGSMLLGLGMFVLFVLYSRYLDEKHRKGARTLLIPILATCAVLVAANLSSFADATIFANRTNILNAASRAKYDAVLQYSPLLKAGRDKVYIVAQKSDGHSYWRLRYNLTPVNTSSDRTWSIGDGPLYEGDMWTQKKTPQAWADELRGYTYVYIDAADSTFVENYGFLFDDATNIEASTMYRVDKTNSTVRLTKVSI